MVQRKAIAFPQQQLYLVMATVQEDEDSRA